MNRPRFYAIIVYSDIGIAYHKKRKYLLIVEDVYAH